MESLRDRNHHSSVRPIMFSDNVPVDIDLMFEQVKWFDPPVYRMHCRIRHREMNNELIAQLKSDGLTYSRFTHFLSLAYELDELEAAGKVEIYNDYENERVGVRKLMKYHSDVVEL